MANTDLQDPKLQSSDVLILDGGMSRELIRANAPFKQPEWSAQALIEAPHTVQKVHENFAAAGADIITTNSYALVPFHIGEDRFWSRAEQLAGLSGQLARAAADDASKTRDKKVLVAGSLPPIFGSYRPDLFDASKVQDYLAVLVRGLTPYVDVWLGETLSTIAEAEAVAVAVMDTGKPLWISFTLEEGEEQSESDSKLRSGESVADAVSKVVELQGSAVMFNCSRPEVMSKAIAVAKAVLVKSNSKIRIGVYANAFEPRADTYAANEDVATIRVDLNREKYGSYAQHWFTEGATIIGGCCGIGAMHIQKVAELLKSS